MLKVIPYEELVTQWNQPPSFHFGIPKIDRVTGGVKAGHLYTVCGEEGVGKTWFCLQLLRQLFLTDPEGEVIYMDFHGHLRIRNVERVIPQEAQLDKVLIVTPATLVEQMVFFRNLNDQPETAAQCKLIILDTLLGQSLDASALQGRGGALLRGQCEDHVMLLRALATRCHIPIIMVHHQPEDVLLGQFDSSLVQPYVTGAIQVRKSLEGTHTLQVSLFHQYVEEISWDLAALATSKREEQ